jgi:hypothetical protein
MSNTHNRHAHAKALRARQRADGHSQFRFASGVLLASAVACQSARKRDPLSACKKDPFGTAV